jgi:hypothetical protein
LPSFDDLVSVVLSVPSGGGTIAGAAEVVDDVVSDDEDCAKAVPVININKQVPVVRYFFMKALCK